MTFLLWNCPLPMFTFCLYVFEKYSFFYFMMVDIVIFRKSFGALNQDNSYFLPHVIQFLTRMQDSDMIDCKSMLASSHPLTDSMPPLSWVATSPGHAAAAKIRTRQGCPLFFKKTTHALKIWSLFSKTWSIR